MAQARCPAIRGTVEATRGKSLASDSDHGCLRSLGALTSNGPITLPLGTAWEVTVFDERAQQIFRLNQVASVIWSAIERGESVDTIDGELQELGCSSEEARTYAQSAITGWLALGWLWPKRLSEALGNPPMISALAIADVTLTVKVFAEQPPRCLNDLFGHMIVPKTSASNELQLVQIDDWWAVLDGRELRGLHRGSDLAPAIKATVTDMFCRALPDGFVVHGALSEIDGSRVLFLGSPGAGKSTLVTALAHAGALCLADDIVRIYDDGLAQGVPFAPGLKTGSWNLFSDPLLSVEGAWSRADGQQVCYMPNVIAHTSRPGPIDHIVLLSRTPGTSVLISEVDEEQVLRFFLESSLSPNGRVSSSTLVSFLERMAKSHFHEIKYGEAADVAVPLRSVVTCFREKTTQ